MYQEQKMYQEGAKNVPEGRKNIAEICLREK